MSAFLGIFIAVTSFLVLYWVFYGQRKHDEMMNPKRKTKLKAILFDLDGVIIDSLDRQHFVFNELLKKYKLKTMSKEDFKKKMWGFSLEVIARNHFQVQDYKKFHKMYMELVKKNVDKGKIFPDTKKVLETVKKNKIKIGLVTNTSRSRAIKDLKFHKIMDYFGVVVSEDDVERPKPFPDPILKACRTLKVEPDETIFVGDTKNDFKAGKSAGCFFVGVDTHGDLIISKLEDLLQLL